MGKVAELGLEPMLYTATLEYLNATKDTTMLISPESTIKSYLSRHHGLLAAARNENLEAIVGPE